ncbi:MFS transporter [Sulfobacillus thermosulfidooxidans]|uniref:MFS transporter n=1 Tax=Sulfobacillus thermosulfidooxidans TaxID=28034 RepID=UPI0009E83707|nr:MFS transporter [Sulfobacillus thermosulfidooxidans]
MDTVNSLLYGQGLILLVYQMYWVTLPWEIYSTTHNAIWALWAFIFEMIPYIGLGLVGGILADRFHRQRLLIILNLTLFLPILLLMMWHYHPLWHILVPLAGFFMGSSLASVLPITESCFPLLSPADFLLQMNARWEAINYVTGFLGPLIGGTLLALAGYVDILIFQGILVLIAVISLYRAPSLKNLGLPNRVTSFSLTRDIVLFLPRHPKLRWGLVFSGFGNFSLATYSSLLVILLRLHLHSSIAQIGLWLGIANGFPYFVNLFIQHASSGIMRLAHHPLRFMAIGVVAQGLGVLWVSWASIPWLVVVGQALYLGGVTVYTTFWRALRQQQTDARWIGRISGLSRSSAYTGSVLGGIMGLWLLHFFAVPQITAAAGFIVMVFGLFSLLIMKSPFFWLSSTNRRASR